MIRWAIKAQRLPRRDGWKPDAGEADHAPGPITLIRRGRVSCRKETVRALAHPAPIRPKWGLDTVVHSTHPSSLRAS